MSDTIQGGYINLPSYPVHRVKDHSRLQRGHRTRLWCSQDEGQKKKKKPKMGEDVVHCDTVGMT